MGFERAGGDTNVTAWLDKEQLAKLEKIRERLQRELGFTVPRGSAIKHLIASYKLED